MLRRSLRSAIVIALLLSPTVAAWAGSRNIVPLHSGAPTGAPGFGGSSSANSAYNVSTALSTALSVGGTTDTASINTNLFGNAGPGGKKAPVVEFNNAPTVQTAVGAAVSIGGNASAAAINTNDISLIGQH